MQPWGIFPSAGHFVVFDVWRNILGGLLPEILTAGESEDTFAEAVLLWMLADLRE